MPWSPDNGPSRHTKRANTPKKRHQWASTANSVRAKAMEDGARESEADAKAVRVANAAVKRNKGKKG